MNPLPGLARLQTKLDKESLVDLVWLPDMTGNPSLVLQDFYPGQATIWFCASDFILDIPEWLMKFSKQYPSERLWNNNSYTPQQAPTFNRNHISPDKIWFQLLWNCNRPTILGVHQDSAEKFVQFCCLLNLNRWQEATWSGVTGTPWPQHRHLGCFLQVATRKIHRH